MITAGFMRACRFFIRQAEYYVGYAIAGGFASVVYVCLLNGGSFEWQELMAVAPHAVVYFAMVILAVNDFYFQYLYALPVSFGCARKHSFCGMLVMEGLVIVESLLIDGILTYLLHMERIEWMVYLGLFLLIAGLSKIFGVVTAKWGKKAQVAMALLSVALITGIGFAVSYAGTSGAFLTITSNLGGGCLQNGRLLLLAIGAGVCLAANAAGWQLIKTYEVRS